MKYLDQSERNFLRENNYAEATVIYQTDIDPDNDTYLNPDLLQKAIKQQFPLNSDCQMGILDWEGRAGKELETDDIESPDYKRVLNEYITAIKTAKKMRPNVKWGFYGLPVKAYVRRDDNWKRRCMSLTPLLQECDFIAPSLYKYKSETEDRGGNEREYIRDNISMALSLGRSLNKPVYPFIWQRIHPANKINGYKLISQTDFRDYISEVTGDFNGMRVAGVIWWSNDKTLMRKRTFLDKLNISTDNERNFDSTDLSVIKKYSAILKTVKY